jgi:hypothetical protein
VIPVAPYDIRPRHITARLRGRNALIGRAIVPTPRRGSPLPFGLSYKKISRARLLPV